MKRTSERHVPGELSSFDDVAMDVRHRYAYSLVEIYAHSDDDLLDVGAGEGYGATIVGDWVASYRGVDVSSETVEHATRRYGSAQVHFDHYAGDTLPYPDDSFDLITSFQVIEHVADVDRYLEELSRVSRPDAAILMTTPNRRLRLRDGERPWNRFHLREYDADGLHSVLESKFSAVELFGIRGSAALESQELTRLARARRLARWDPLGLRYSLPRAIDAPLRSALRRRRGPGDAPQPSVGEMWRTKDELDRALDLFAVLRAAR
jgi:SAM-dependent methyltransferase